ncbi:protein of unknown function [Enterobacter cancerogenus]|nr:protein of unknown function [Enterobacter cancerogenus]
MTFHEPAQPALHHGHLTNNNAVLTLQWQHRPSVSLLIDMNIKSPEAQPVFILVGEMDYDEKNARQI